MILTPEQQQAWDKIQDKIQDKSPLTTENEWDVAYARMLEVKNEQRKKRLANRTPFEIERDRINSHEQYMRRPRRSPAQRRRDIETKKKYRANMTQDQKNYEQIKRRGRYILALAKKLGRDPNELMFEIPFRPQRPPKPLDMSEKAVKRREQKRKSYEKNKKLKETKETRVTRSYRESAADKYERLKALGLEY